MLLAAVLPTYCLLPTAYCLLPTAYYLLLTLHHHPVGTGPDSAHDGSYYYHIETSPGNVGDTFGLAYDGSDCASLGLPVSIVSLWYSMYGNTIGSLVRRTPRLEGGGAGLRLGVSIFGISLSVVGG